MNNHIKMNLPPHAFLRAMKWETMNFVGVALSIEGVCFTANPQYFNCLSHILQLQNTNILPLTSSWNFFKC